MKFGAVPVTEAAGAILAHGRMVAGKAWKKGRRLSDEDIALLADREDTIIVARPEADDLGEDEAARRLAEALCGPGAVMTDAFTGPRQSPCRKPRACPHRCRAHRRDQSCGRGDHRRDGTAG